VRKSLDPFHDFEVNIMGYPDANNSKVVIQEVTLSKQIATYSNGQGYDMHIATLPELHTLGGNLNQALNIDNLGTATSANATFNFVGNNFPFGPVCVVTGPVGQDTFYDGSAATGGKMEVFDFSNWYDGQKRVVAMAFEVHDTTAELYKQGTVTTYRLPQVIDTQQLNFIYSTNTSKTPTVCYMSRSPPADLSSALLLQGSRQWEASHGCYCVATFDDRRMDLTGSHYGTRVFTTGDLSTEATNYGFGQQPLADGTNQWACQLRSWKPIPFHTSGAYFTGLNANSTFTVTVKLILEVAPTPENQQLVVLAKPSPDYDPLAIEIYKHASQLLPPGVPVGENASGDFWDKVLMAIESAAPVLSSFIPVPGASVLGSLAGKAASIGRSIRNGEPSDRKQLESNFSVGKPGGQGGKNSVPAKKKRLIRMK